MKPAACEKQYRTLLYTFHTIIAFRIRTSRRWWTIWMPWRVRLTETKLLVGICCTANVTERDTVQGENVEARLCSLEVTAALFVR